MFLSPKLLLLAFKGPFVPLRAPFKWPLNSSKTEIFKNNNFFCFTLSHWAYLPKIMFLSPKLRLLAIKGPLGPLRARGGEKGLTTRHWRVKNMAWRVNVKFHSPNWRVDFFHPENAHLELSWYKGPKINLLQEWKFKNSSASGGKPPDPLI